MPRSLSILLLTILACSSAAEVSKCRKADGSLVFTDSSCPAGTQAEAFSSETTVNSIPMPTLVPEGGPEENSPAVGTISDPRRSRQSDSEAGCTGSDCDDDHDSSAETGVVDNYWIGTPIRPRPRPPIRPERPHPRPTPETRPQVPPSKH
ncbi:DUF4124 domain-containing protein [Chitinilyticum aquatile]|uniref:DUF4124 domain-containing protein n=1 Tax=Chitinilyticum aquatile TaxID=362520 RepID=UPI000420D7F3|nr:DUF4124 domain-containing protein [Chitinilyticum aquatile]